MKNSLYSFVDGGEMFFGNCAFDDTSMKFGMQSEYVMKKKLGQGPWEIIIFKNIGTTASSESHFDSSKNCLLFHLCLFTHFIVIAILTGTHHITKTV